MTNPEHWAWRVTSVSLDERTKALADEKQNFSKWVRTQLLREASLTAGHQTAEGHRVDGLCNPMTSVVCSLCWPDGRPARQDWLTFRERRLNGHPHPQPEPAFGAASITEKGWQIEGDNYHQVADNLARHELNKLWTKVVGVIIAIELLCASLGL